MKKLKYLLLIIVGSFLLIGTANAAVKTETLKEACETEKLTCNFTEKDTSKLPNIYIFRGNGCGYCQKLLNYMSSIYDKISDKVNVVVYEVGSNNDNWSLYKKVAAKYGDEVQGYPYMVIGKTVFDGYTSSYDKSILEAIETLAESEEKYDAVKEVNEGNYDLVNKKETNENKKESNAGPVIAFIFGIVVVIGLITGYYIIKK